MTTETDICNLALDILKEAPITSIEDGRPIAMWLKRNFYITRDSVLSRADWNFAMSRALIAKDSEPPAFGWAYSYTKPSNCLRIAPLTQCGAAEGIPIPHEVEGDKILTDYSGPLKVRFVTRTEAYDRYPATFTEAFSARLAMKMGHWLTGKVSYVQIAQGLYKEAMDDAWLIDAIEGTSPRAADNDWVDAR